MKKLIAKTQNGKEYLHSKTNAFFVHANGKKIVDQLNKVRYQLNKNEKWYIYDYDFTQDFYVNYKIYLSKTGAIKSKLLN